MSIQTKDGVHLFGSDSGHETSDMMSAPTWLECLVLHVVTLLAFGAKARIIGSRDAPSAASHFIREREKEMALFSKGTS